MLDLDGTIIQNGVDVSPRIASALKRTREVGCLLAVSSGRPFGMMPRAVLKLGVMDYFLCANGAKVLDARGHALISHPLARDEVKKLMEEVTPLGAKWYVYVGDRCLIERTGVTYISGGVRSSVKRLIPRSPRQLRATVLAVIHRFVGERGKRIVNSVLPIVERNDSFDKVGCSFPNSESCERAVQLIRDLGGFEVARVWERELEITAEGVTKGTTADELLALAGIERARTIAFGDSENDAPLIGHVGHFVAVGNASQELKDLADEVCAPLSEDGVAQWLETQLMESTQ